MPDFTPPIRATQHCRHYSYDRGPNGGPSCAAGVTLDGLAPGWAIRRCGGDPTELCHARAEYTDGERAAWASARDARMARLGTAIAALPAPIPLRTSGQVNCPNCDGQLRYERWERGASIACSTPWCTGAQFNIARGADWPDPKLREARRGE